MQIVEDRRALHRIAELDRDLPQTLAYLKKALQGLGCRVFSPVQGALCAWFDFGRDHAIAFRADMDALPIEEKTGAPYASQNRGTMHACGHDGHMAILLELARRLDRKKDLPHNVLLVFQPAEETTGGAKDICQSGVFEAHHVAAIFGLHLWPGLEKGGVFSRKKELMSRSCSVFVDISGRSAHIASADLALDATAAAVTFYQKAMAMEKALAPSIFRLLKFGKLQSGTVGNVISCAARLEGSLRAFQDDVFESLQTGLTAIGKEVEDHTGCRVMIRFHEGYPAVMNPEDLFEKVRGAVAFRELEKPSMTAEDFSYYQKQIPGMFFFLGLGDVPGLHADTFDFDETVLLKGADLFEKLAEEFS